MREFVIKRLRRAPIIEPLWDEFERMLAARDAALAERDRALAVRDAALIERDAALAARDAALIERDAALAARDAALIARDAALVERQGPRIEPILAAATSEAPDGHPEQAGEIGFDDLAEHLDPALLPLLDRPDIDETALTPEQRSWRRDGVLVLPGFLPDDLVDAYVERRAQHPHVGGWVMPTPYLHVPEMRALALYPPLLKVMESLIGEPMMLHLALTGWISTQRTWHQDDYLNPAHVAGWYAAVWIALDEIHPDSGPFEYVPGSHRWPTLRREKVLSLLSEEERERRDPASGELLWPTHWPTYAERFVTPAVSQQISRSQLPIRSFLGKKGDVLIWNGRLMHQGSLPREPGMPRRALITHYTGVNHRPDMAERAQDPGGGVYALTDHEFV